jgi:ribonuclease P protein component
MRRIRGVPLTLSDEAVYLSKLFSKRCFPMDRAAGHEADIQAPQPQAGEQARVPRPHEDQERAQDAEPAEAAGAYTHHGSGRREVAASERDGSEGLPTAARIARSGEIRRLLEVGKRKRTPNLDVFVGGAPGSRSRLGLIVPKHGRRIVDRNLLKRRLREIGRRQVLPQLDAADARADVLIRARGRAYGVDFDSLAREVREAVEGLCSDES